MELFGPADKNLRLLRDAFDVKVFLRDYNLVITGPSDQVKKAASIIDKMQKHVLKHGKITPNDVQVYIDKIDDQPSRLPSETLEVYSNKKIIEPNTKGQLKYIETMLKNDLTFCIGPAGTGKTYLAVAVAVSMLKKKQIRRIVLARPAVEAGEKLGFLPGDLQAKVNPYLRPLFDALGDMMGFAQMRKFMELDIIEVAPLAFMRGRTLNECAVICDEAQNTSTIQMLMMLTRLGNGSKMIITGDITQTDLPAGQKSGLLEAIRTLGNVKGIGITELNQADIVRHRLVQDIVSAYKEKTDHDTDKLV